MADAILVSELSAFRASGDLNTAGDKILDILDVFATSPTPELALSDLSTLTELTKSTTLRIIRLLERRGYIHRTDGERYLLSEASLILGQQAQAGCTLRAIALPILIRLCEEFDDATNLMVPRWPAVLYLERVIPPLLRASFSAPGKLSRFYASAGGKVLAAFQPGDLIAQLLETSLVALTERTITDPTLLKRELQETRRRGWAVDNEELRIGVKCIAAPVRNARGMVVASIGLSSVSPRPIDDEWHVRAVRDAGNSLSGLLGYT